MRQNKKLFLYSICCQAISGLYACTAPGPQGAKGATGEKGDSCTVVTNADGTATIKCGDGSFFNVVNGKDGQPGDAGSDGKDGQDGKSCYLTENLDGSAAVVCPYDGSSYIVRGNPDHYAYYCKEGYAGDNCERCQEGRWGKNCENECTCKHGTCNDGFDGDGTCLAYSCTEYWRGTDCDTCESNYYDGKSRCVGCYGGSPAFNGPKCTVTDSRDGHVYRVIHMENQLWIAENMVYAPAGKSLGKDYFYPDGNSDNLKDYGYLYTWNAATDICPEGWHLPIEDLDTPDGTRELSSLLSTMGCINVTYSMACDASWLLDEENFRLRRAGMSYLPDLGPAPVNEGFGKFTYLWSATKIPDDADKAYVLYMEAEENEAEENKAKADIRSLSMRNNGTASVRCVKDLR